MSFLPHAEDALVICVGLASGEEYAVAKVLRGSPSAVGLQNLVAEGDVKQRPRPSKTLLAASLRAARVR